MAQHAKRRRFASLRWKLTWSYVWVTVLITSVMTVVTLWGIITLIRGATPNRLLELTQNHTRDLAELWEKGEPEPAILQMVLRYKFGLSKGSSPTEQAVFSLGNPQPTDDIYLEFQPTMFAITSTMPVSSSAIIVVTDLQGRVIAGSFPASSPHGQPVHDPLNPSADELIQSALNDMPVEDLVQPIYTTIAAALPIRYQSKIVGVLYIRTQPMVSLKEFLLPFLGVSLVVSIVFTLITNGIIGMIYGFFAARPLARRIKQLTNAASAMTQGNLQARVSDPSGDEIGQLGHQFNTMAAQLEANLYSLRQLADHNAALAEQASQLATIEERNRLARDLHDSVSQELFSVTMLAAAAENLVESNPQRASEHLLQLRQMAQRAHYETRALIFALRPAALGDQGLAPALRQLCETARDRQGLEIDLKIQGERRIPLDQEQVFYRITQEALANIARHSDTRKATLTLNYGDTNTILIVSDNGKGFDTSVPHRSHSLGLISIDERINSVGGTWSIQSTLGQGTIVRAEVPRERIM